MWLVDAKTKKLVNIVAEWQVYQSYAIVSHTWGEDELIFQDMHDGKYKDKKGYAKLQFACQQAIKDGLKYVWLDTCCIDKSSSAELSEAINSMFRWYDKAARCYAYLEDVPQGKFIIRDAEDTMMPWTMKYAPVSFVITPADGEGSEEVLDDEWRTFGSGRTTRASDNALLSPMDTKQSKWRWRQGYHTSKYTTAAQPITERRMAFRKSKWFTRGWTLQELIAPNDVLFFDCGWNLLGVKHELLMTLSDITTIEPMVLRASANLEFFSVAQKLSWAARRETSRPEDRAYSLLGLVEVNMPLLYGEGGKQAFQRLQEQIISRTTDQSIFAWGDPSSTSTHSKSTHSTSIRSRLLASSPTDFGGSRRVVRCDVGGTDEAYELSNSGLRIRLKMILMSQSVYLGVLNCRYEDDVTGPLAVRLRRHILRDKEAAGEIPVYRISDERDIAINDSPHTLTLVPIEQMEEARSEQIMILRNAVWEDTPLTSAPKAPTFRFCGDNQTREDWVIVAVHPERWWNLRNGVFCPPLSLRDTWSGMISLIRKGQRTKALRSSQVNILFSGRAAKPNDCRHKQPNCELETIVNATNAFRMLVFETDGKTFVPHDASLLDGLQPSSLVELKLADGGIANVVAELKEMMGRPTFDIKVHIAEGCEERCSKSGQFEPFSYDTVD